MDNVLTKGSQDKCPIGARYYSSLRENWLSTLILLFFAFVAYEIYSNAASSYNWQWYRVWKYFVIEDAGQYSAGVLTLAVFTTLKLVIISFILAFFIALVVCAFKLSDSKIQRLLANLYIGWIRNTPLLLQLFIAYFIFAPVFNASPFATACVALALFEAAYMAEIFRAGIIAVPRSQWEAAISMGMSAFQASKIVIFPQALRHILPAFTGQIVSLIKDSSLVSAIAVADLTMRAQEIISETFLSFEIWLLVALIYLFLNLLISIPAKALEKYKTY